MNQIAAGEFVPPCYLLMGLRGVETGDGVATLAMAKSPWLCNAFGVIYGGAIAYLADAAMIVATGSIAPAGTAFNTIDLKVNFLRPVLPERDELQAQAVVVHRGRTISLVNCDIIDASGKLAARATSSFLMLPGRFWEHPVHVATNCTKRRTRRRPEPPPRPRATTPRALTVDHDAPGEQVDDRQGCAETERHSERRRDHVEWHQGDDIEGGRLANMPSCCAARRSQFDDLEGPGYERYSPESGVAIVESSLATSL
jgi:uncharacterized protein (TIGR00369 family)